MIHSGALPHLDNVHIDWPLWQNVKLENGTRLPDEKHAEFRWAKVSHNSLSKTLSTTRRRQDQEARLTVCAVQAQYRDHPGLDSKRGDAAGEGDRAESHG